jgi:hypothetical protein
MELGNYLLGKQTLLILPRFMRNEDYLPSLLVYLEKVGYTDDDIDIYPEIPLIIKKDGKRTNVYLYEWVTHPRLLVNLLSINPQVINLSYIADPYQITFGIKNILMTNEMSDLYPAFDHLSEQQKLMYGNHYYGSLTPAEINDSLIDEKYITEYKGGNIESKLNKPLFNLRDVHIPHPSKDVKDSRHLELDSPKITEIIKQFTIKPGKYVIMTDFRGSYGASVIQRILSNLFQTNINLIDEFTPCEIANDIIDHFNSRKYDFLITSVVPHRRLGGVNSLIIFDSYNYNKIMGLLRSSYEPDLKVILLAETHHQLETISSIKARETLDVLHKQEDTYRHLVDVSKSIMIKGSELYVV